MKLLIRIALIVLAIPVLLFVIGFVGGLLGILELPDRSDPEPEPVAEAVEAEPQPYRKPIEGDGQAGETVTNAAPQLFNLPPLPAVVDASSALDWLSTNQLLRVRDGLIEIDVARFASLSAEDALALLWAFKDAQNAATGDRRNQFRLIAGYIVMGAAFLPEAERLAFAQQGKLVAWPGSGSDITRSGEFVLMFYLKGPPDQERAEAAIRGFAPMLPGSDILSALDRVGAIRVGRAADERWSYALDRIRHLHPDTLQRLLDFIGPWERFDSADDVEFGYAKDRLRDLIRERRAETGE